MEGMSFKTNSSISTITTATKGKKDDLYHVIHKVPSGDTPYVRAKHAQVILLLLSWTTLLSPFSLLVHASSDM